MRPLRRFFFGICLMIIASCTEIEKPVFIQPTEKLLTGIKSLITSPVQLESNTVVIYDDKNRVSETKTIKVQGNKNSGQKMFLNAAGKIKSLVSSAPDADLKIDFFYENGSISKTEWREEGILISYNVYQYQNDKLQKYATFAPNDQGSEPLKIGEVHLEYDQMGNLLQKESFIWIEDEDKMLKISMESYGPYTDITNPFYSISYLPEEKIQQKIPHQVKYHGISVEIIYDYEVFANANASPEMIIIKESTGKNEQIFFTYRSK